MNPEQLVVDVLRNKLCRDEEYAEKFFTTIKYIYILGDLSYTIRAYQHNEMDREALEGVMRDVRDRLLEFQDNLGDLPMESVIMVFRISEILIGGMDICSEKELDNMAKLAELMASNDFSKLLEMDDKSQADSQQVRAGMNG